jgi:hypothetical protein
MNRIAIILNITSLVSLVVFFELLKANNRNLELLIYGIVPLLVLLITFVKFYIISGLWNHLRKINKEKRKEMALESIATSYSIFTITIIITLMIYHFFNVPLNMILISSLLYLAHIIPAYLANWNKLYKPRNEN